MDNDKTKVLVIDDEEDFCFFVRENLTALNRFDVVIANSGRRGLELARSESPDIILLDMVMPDMSGEQVWERLQETSLTGNIPVVFLTALATRAETGEKVYKKIGQHWFIAKPVRTKELARAIEQLLVENR
jgi:CheY-like chemotaxis protein